jgi:eukaryotic-like serine/threonine-protein kinase
MNDKSQFDSLFARVSRQLDIENLSLEDSIRDEAVGLTREVSTVLLNVDSQGLSRVAHSRERLPTLRVDDDAAAAFEVKDVLGVGGMGRVELAIQHSLGREVALKRAKEAIDEESAEAILQEARVSGLLDHPNIIPIHELGLDENGSPVIVMKRVVGDAWRALVRNDQHPRWKTFNREPLRQNLEILSDVCNAVHFAHSRGVLHRDIKPENVMIGEFGEVYLVDWGLALLLSERDPNSERLVGTPAYLAPEMLEGESACSERTDVYLLGATLHEVLLKQCRHKGSAFQALNSAFRSKAYDYPETVPLELANLCNDSMHRDPAKRPQSALEFRQAIERFLDHYGSIELSDRAFQNLGQLQDASDTQSEQRTLVMLFAECRFAFEQALRIWPENHRARDGLQDCLEWMIDRELKHRNKGMVASLLAALPIARPALEEQLRALEQELENEATTNQRLQYIERQMDLSVSGRLRSRMMFGIAIIAGCAVFFMRIFQNKFELSYQRDSYAMVAITIGMALSLFIGRRPLFRTTINRRLTYSAVIALAVVILNRVVGHALGLGIRQSMAYDGVVMTTVLLMMGNAIDRRLLWIVPVSLSATLLTGFWPEYFFEITGVGGVICYLMLSAIWSSDEKNDD